MYVTICGMVGDKMLKDIVKAVNNGSILYDNENLSLPFFRVINGKEELVFFTYIIEFNITKKQNVIGIGRGFVVKIEDSLVLEQFDLPKEVPQISDKVFHNLPEIKEYAKINYDEMVALTDNMISCCYSTESINLYALAFEQFVSKQTKQIYMYISEQYFKDLDKRMHF